MLNARVKIDYEQEWWLSQSLKVRAEYEGEYVAIHNKELVDHDGDENALYRRIVSRYGNIPVMIMPAEGPKDINSIAHC